MKNDWPTRPLSEYVTSRPGNNKIIKGKQSDQPGDGLVQAFSASGPDVWVTTADYSQPGVVISAVGARCGKTFIAEGEWTAIANTHVLLPGKQIDPRWLWYRTNEETFWIRGGTAQPFVKVKDTLQQQCKIPPLAEQQRIVGLLDEAFEGLANAKANAEKNLQNARSLFESHLQAVFTQRGEGWVEKTLGDICVVDWGNTDLTKSSYVDGGKYLAVSAAGCDGRIGHKEHAKHTPVLSAIGAQCGRMFLPEEDFTAIKNTITLTPRVGTCAGKFLYRLLTHVELPKRGAAQPFIAKGDILKFQIVVPEDSEAQLRIVDSLDELEEEIQRLARLYERKLAALEELKKSLLHQAFSGDL